MKSFRVDVAGLALAGLVGVCLTVCAVVGAEPPSFRAELGLVALGVGGGAAFPRGAAAQAAPAPVPAAPAAPATYPAPRAASWDDEPTTGLFSRVEVDR